MSADYPAVVIRDLDMPEAIGGVQLFPSQSESHVSVGFVIIEATEGRRWSFDDAVEHWTDFYAETENVKPTFHAGRAYLRNYFGVWFGPLNADPSDPEACVAEAVEALREEGWGVIDQRVSSRLEYLRSQIEAEQISYAEIAELQGLAEHIDPSDVVLREWAGVPEDVATR